MKSNKILFLLSFLGIFFTAPSYASLNQFRERLSCYSDIENFGHKSSSAFFQFNRVAQLGVDYTSALLNGNPGYILVLPGKSPANSTNRGFYTVFNDGIYWHKFKTNPKPDGKILDRRYKLDIPGLKNNIYVDYPDFLNSDGTEYGNINIVITQKPSTDKSYENVTPGAQLTPETEKLFAQDLITRINDVPRVFLRHNELRSRRKQRAEPVGRDLKNKDEFIQALEKCKDRLNSTKDAEIIAAISRAISTIDPTNKSGTTANPPGAVR